MAEYQYSTGGCIGLTRIDSYGRTVHKSILKHRLVWILANGPIPPGHMIHHKNGNKFDNRLENLECITHSEHRLKHPRKSQSQSIL